MENNNAISAKPVLDFLKNHSLNDLREIHAVRFKVVNHLVTLAYHQFEAKNDNPITNLCRGMIIARADGSTNIDPSLPFGEAVLLAFPFVRFFNYGQTNLCFKPSRIYEKLDGTLAIVYYDSVANVWNVATRNVPDGSNVADNATHTFRELFEFAIASEYGLNWNEFTSRLQKGMTYIFELMTPENIVVVKHTEYKVALIGARDSKGFEHYSEIEALRLGLNYPTTYNSLVQNFVSFDDIVKLANNRDPMKHEGYVLMSSSWQRLKIKSDSYCTFNKVHDLTKYDILNYILVGTIDDIIPLLQNDYHRNLVEEISLKVSNWARMIHIEMQKLNAMHFESRKDLAFYLNSNNVHACVKNFSRDIFRNYLDNNGKLSMCDDSIELIARHKNPITGNYTDSFLRTMFNESGYLS